MSKFLCKCYQEIQPYAAGEQPRDREYIKLNANETSCPPSPAVLSVLKSERMEQLGRYTDPDSTELRTAIAKHYDLPINQIMVANGTDESLTFIFQAFFLDKKICLPDITYNYYETLANSFHIDSQYIPLLSDFRIDVAALIATDRHIIIPNPNAPTGLVLSFEEIKQIVSSRPNRLVVIDEAYVDFGNKSCFSLTKKYDNLIVAYTMSKAFNLAGAHIGYCIASPGLIRDLNNIKGVFNPFNISDINQAVGAAAINDTAYLQQSTQAIIQTRNYTMHALRRLGFFVLESHTNFVFISHPNIGASEFNQQLRDYAILARWYNQDRIRNFLRITIGTQSEMEQVIDAIRNILAKIAA